MQFWPALVLGLVGSLHCAGMCGPLAIAVPATGGTRTSFAAGRLAYNFGRLTTYSLLGVFFGLIGISFDLFGLQRWVSIASGAALLAGLAVSVRRSLNPPLFKVIGRLRSSLGLLLKRRSIGSAFLLGLLNGFLPCGLVYVAGAAAAAGGSLAGSVGYMLLFGLGTVPTMLSIGLAGGAMRLSSRLRFQSLVPIGIGVLGVLLIIRGLNLGIPYLSPAIGANCPACH